MKLYSSAAGPRRQDFYPADVAPASAYALQQEVKKAYREILFHWFDLDAVILACFGPRTGKRLGAAEDRLQYEVPELLERMSPAELHAAAEVLQQQTLVGFVWHVLGQERTIQHRLEEGNCSTRLKDDSHAKAASFGHAPMKRARPTVQRQAPVKPEVRKAAAPALRVQRSQRFWSQVRKQSQLSIWPPVESAAALGAGVTGGGL